MSFLSSSDPTKHEINIGSKIRAVACLSERIIISCEENTGIQQRDLDNQLVGQPIEAAASALAVAASRDGRWIVTGTSSGLTIRDKDLNIVAKHAIDGVRTIDISTDSKWVVTGSDARTVDIWELSTGDRRPGIGPLKHEYNVITAKFCPCGDRLATATLFGSIRIFDVKSATKLFTIPVGVTSSFTALNAGLLWYTNPSRLYVVSQGQIKCLYADDGSISFQWPMRRVSYPSSVSLSPNNKMMAYCANEVVFLRNVATRDQIGDSLKHEGNVTCLAFSPGNKRLVVGAETKFTIWNLEKFVDASLLEVTEPSMSCVHQDKAKPLPPTFLLPLMSISNNAVKPWLHFFIKEAEEVFTKDIAEGKLVDHHTYANRALMRGRLNREDEALKDAEQSLRMEKSAIGQIAKTISLIKKKDFQLALKEAPKILTICSPGEHGSLLEVIEKILTCLAGEYRNVFPTILGLIYKDKTLKLLVQANMHLTQEEFEPAMKSFKSAHVPVMFPYDETPDMRTIYYIFGWRFSGLGVQIQQEKCNFLLAAGKSEAADLFREVMDIYHREIVTHVELSDWAIEFRRDCITKIERIGDESGREGDHKKAAKHYTAVIGLVGEPEIKHALLLKRSDAHVAIGPESWTQALMDADEAVRLNSISPWGYERRHLVLFKLHHYHEAAEALDKVFSSIPYSQDPRSTDLIKQGVKALERRKIILDVAEDTFNWPRPHMLINTESGKICDKQKQIEAYRADPMYKDLVLDPKSPVGKVGTEWQESVRKYFRYTTFSHTWEEIKDGGELEYREVEPRTIDRLMDAFSTTKLLSTTKLQTFCRKTREHKYNWGWSDTCCINKAEREVLDVALRSMYRWYSESSLTIVHLKGVRDPIIDSLDISELLAGILDDLLKAFVECRWNQRAWTLQEYFASSAIHFYTENWQPYLPIEVYHPDDEHRVNHKIHDVIKWGMRLVTGLDPERLEALKPGSDDARQKLRLASVRKASRKEDIAYSLLGIFKVTIEAIYGDDEVPRALGRLLGALLSQSADVSILAWTGRPSEYNTCLPAEIIVYKDSELDYIPEAIEKGSMSIPGLSDMDLELAIKLHDRLLDCPHPEILHGRLKLSCILFQIGEVSPNPIRNTYTVTVNMLGKIELRTLEDLSSSRNVVLVHPWFRHLLNPGISMSESARKESAERLMVALRRPFGALLLAFNRASQDYRRIVADQLIQVSIPEHVSARQLLDSIHVLHIR